MQIFSAFGFEPAFFFAQIVNFLILAFVFKKFLYKPILKVIRDREKKIAQGLEDAQKATLELEEANTKRDEIIKKATLEAEKIIDETKKSADTMRDELMANSKRESDRIIAEAKAAAEEEFKKANDRAEEMALAISRKLLDKILGQIFTKQEKEKIIERNIKVLEKYE